MNITAFQPRNDPTSEPAWQCRPPTSQLYQRLLRLHERLIAVLEANHSVSVENRCTAAEIFIRAFLSEVFPSAFRFEPGNVVDANGNQSGMLDILVESPFVPCLPAVEEDQPRQYLAEGVAAALIVKPVLPAAWNEVLAAATTLAPLRRNFASFSKGGPVPMRRVPLFAIGCSGWISPELVKQRLVDGEVDGILIIEPGIFVSAPAFGGVVARGSWALWTFIASLHQAISALAAASTELLPYAIEKKPLTLPPAVPVVPAELPGRKRAPEKEPTERVRRTLRQPG